MNKTKVTRASYEDEEIALIDAASHMIIKNNLTVSYAAESLSNFYPNRTIKAIELKLAKTVRDLKKTGHVSMVVSEKEPSSVNTHSNVLNTINSTSKTEDTVINPFDVILGMISSPNEIQTNTFTSTAASDASSEESSESNDYLTYRNRFLPQFDSQHIGLTYTVQINKITDYGFFADDGEHSGLVHISHISKNYLSREDLYRMFNIGDRLEVTVERNQFNINKVLLQPTQYDKYGHIVLLGNAYNEFATPVNNNVVIEDVEETQIEEIVQEPYSTTINLEKLDSEMVSIFPIHLESQLIATSFEHHLFSHELDEDNKTISISFETPLSDDEIVKFNEAIDECINFLI